MKKHDLIKFLFFLILSLILSLLRLNLAASDWPIYKGNIYFTGNNDEIIVKNNNLKWLFQADERVFNPVVSDGRIYFIDMKGNLYCLDEEYGKLIWKKDLRSISSQFKAFSRAAGKVKYPLVQGPDLFLTDPIAVYAFDKVTGNVHWARTGMRKDDIPAQGLYKGTVYGRKGLPQVDGIYSDPVLHEGRIYYGTREMFLSREARNGHVSWENDSIKSFSGFPTFYDRWIITQSMDYGTGIFQVHCLDSANGAERWTRRIEKPLKIYPPVVYKGRVFIPSGSKIYSLDIKTGETVWDRDYGAPVTSHPGFTDRAILFSINNSDILAIDPDNGSELHRLKFSPKSGPLFVIVRDQIYVAMNESSTYKGKRVPYGVVRAQNFTESGELWTYKTPFPGAVSQPVASKGILFLPAGNYLYAIGTEYYARVVEGGSGHAVAPGAGKGPAPDQRKMTEQSRDKKEKIATRKMKIDLKDRDGKALKGNVTVTMRDKGRTVYKKSFSIDRSGTVDVPDSDGVEIIAESEGYLPGKTVVNRKDRDKTITLNPLQRGKAFVVDNIYFEFNKAYLKKESLDLLDRLIDIMRKRPDIAFEVRGHTDSKGDPAYNQKLSERRADAVIEYMIKNGISPERLRSKGFGETRPVASNKTAEGRSKNRRTEFYIIDKH